MLHACEHACHSVPLMGRRRALAMIFSGSGSVGGLFRDGIISGSAVAKQSDWTISAAAAALGIWFHGLESAYRQADQEPSSSPDCSAAWGHEGSHYSGQGCLRRYRRVCIGPSWHRDESEDLFPVCFLFRRPTPDISPPGGRFAVIDVALRHCHSAVPMRMRQPRIQQVNLQP